MSTILTHEYIKQMRMQPAERQSEYWLPEEKEKLLEMYHDGYGITEISAYFGRGEAAIISMLNYFDVLPKQKRKKKPTCLCPECAFYVDGNCIRKEACEKLL